MSVARFRCASDPPSSHQVHHYRNTGKNDGSFVALSRCEYDRSTIHVRSVPTRRVLRLRKKSRFAEVNVARENNGTLVNVQLSRVTTATKLRRKLLSPSAHYNEYASKNHRPYPIRSTKHNPYTAATKRRPYNEPVRQMPPWSVTIGRTLGFDRHINNIVTKDSNRTVSHI